MANKKRKSGGSDWNWGDFFAYGAVAVGAIAAGKGLYNALTTDDVGDIREKMKKLVVERAQQLDWRAGALRITTSAGVAAGDKLGQARALHAFARGRLSYLSDPALPNTAFTSAPEVTLKVGGGDCKWLSTALATLFVAHGLATRFVFHPAVNPTHALLMVNVPFEQFRDSADRVSGFVEKDPSGVPTTAWVIVEPQSLAFGDIGEDTDRCLKTRDFTEVVCA